MRAAVGFALTLGTLLCLIILYIRGDAVRPRGLVLLVDVLG